MDMNGNTPIKFSEIAHLYLGAKCEFKISGELELHDEYGKLIGAPISGTEWFLHVPDDDRTYPAFIQDIKPILRPLSDMTEEEAIQIAKIEGLAKAIIFCDEDSHFTLTDDSYTMTIDKKLFGITVMKDGRWFQGVSQAKQFHYLLSKHFDLFGLLDSNQAISKQAESKE